VRTTPSSVAGRGLFYCAQEPAQQGDMLAFIPSRCILTTQTAQCRWPDLKAIQKDTAMSNDYSECNFANDWPVALTACAQRALDSDVAWSQWIQTWQGPSAPCPPDSLSIKELQNLAKQTRSSVNEIQKALQVRYTVFQQHSRRLNDFGITIHDDLYGIVLSRAASLGPHWNNESGIIPLHDMLNHPPLDKTPSVELFSIGEIASHTSVEHVAHVAASTFSQTELQDTDLAIVARQTIYPGEELLLSYTKRDLLAKEETRIWKMLQYGFCL